VGQWSDTIYVRTGELSGSTSSNGEAAFLYDFTFTSMPPSERVPQITVVEQQQAGYTLTPQDGKNAVCTAEVQPPLPVANRGAGNDGAVRVSAAVNKGAANNGTTRQLNVTNTTEGFTVDLAWYDEDGLYIDAARGGVTCTVISTAQPAATQAQAPKAALPNTGSKTTPMLIAIGALAVLGTALLLVARKARAHS
jgi:LPXTG-motif cell wall-anchored protein